MARSIPPSSAWVREGCRIRLWGFLLWAAYLAYSVCLDCVTTYLALSYSGLWEAGPLAARLLPVLGPLYFAVEYLGLLVIGYTLTRLACSAGLVVAARASLAAPLVVPLAAAANNIIHFYVVRLASPSGPPLSFGY